MTELRPTEQGQRQLETLRDTVLRPQRVPPLREAVDVACVKHQRDPNTFERSLTVGVTFDGAVIPTPSGHIREQPISGSVDAIAAALWGFADEGISHQMLLVEPRTLGPIEQLGQVIALTDRSRHPS